MKIFHSMPLAGRTPAEIEYARKVEHKMAKEAVAKYLNISIDECEILDTFIKENVPENANALWYFGEGVRTYLSQADILVLGKGWSNARGCLSEQYIAESYGIPAIILDDYD